MDLIVSPVAGATEWLLVDLLGRSMGSVVQSDDAHFVIRPAGHAQETMAGMATGPHASLDAALAEIEKHTRGVCRRNPGQDQP